MLIFLMLNINGHIKLRDFRKLTNSLQNRWKRRRKRIGKKRRQTLSSEMLKVDYKSRSKNLRKAMKSTRIYCSINSKTFLRIRAAFPPLIVLSLIADKCLLMDLLLLTGLRNFPTKTVALTANRSLSRSKSIHNSSTETPDHQWLILRPLSWTKTPM